MRTHHVLMCILMLAYPAAGRGQSFELYGAAGPTIIDRGHSFAAGFGISPTSRLTFLINVERTHLSTVVRTTGQSSSYFRGGTYLLGSGELRFAPLRRGRVGPFGVAGFAAGVSRPNVNEVFPTPVTNTARAVFGGGGLLVPLGERVTAFADARMLIGAEGTEGIVAVVPVRAGLSLRF